MSIKKVSRHQLTIKKKHVAEVTSRLETSKRDAAMQIKDEHARLLIMKLSAAKLAKDEQILQSLERNNFEILLFPMVYDWSSNSLGIKSYGTYGATSPSVLSVAQQAILSIVLMNCILESLQNNV